MAWTAASLVALAVGLMPVHAAILDGHYIPVGNDSFYHAYRILAMLGDPGQLFEFDTRIHVPEGSLIIWPWGYDYFMSLLVRIGLTLGISDDPMAILDHLPAFAFPLSLALVVAVCRQLRASIGATFAALLATALFPMNQGMYGVGNVDHHFVEQLVTLGTLAAGMAWLHKPEANARAIVTGALLGLCLCLHNAFFILQLPLVAAFAMMWMRGVDRPRNTWLFSVALLTGALAAALPSMSLRLGHFEFYTLSWFHVYFSACVAVGCVLLQRTTFSTRSALIIVTVVVLMAAPVIGQALLAGKFLSVKVEGADAIAETQSVWGLIQTSGIGQAFRLYTPFVAALPITLLLAAWRLWRETDPRRVLFWIHSILGLTLLASMLRMHAYGSFALYLPWLLIADEYLASRGFDARKAGLTIAAATVVFLIPGLSVLLERKTPGNDLYYALSHELFTRLGDECRTNPGVVLASLDDGNYIRYHSSSCSIIANNFLLTPQHEAKVRETHGLLSMPAAALLQRNPSLRYVLIRRNSLFFNKAGGGRRFVPEGDPSLDWPLVNELLSASPDQLPAGMRMVQELAFEQPRHLPYARLFVIER